MKTQALRNLLFIAAATILFAGCNTVFQNFTPERIPQNPSGIYTFSFTANVPTTAYVPGSAEAQIVINGESYNMKRSSEDDLTFTFDYKLPPGVTEARYYYILNYDYKSSGKTESETKYSTEDTGKIYRARLINRYPIQLVNDRGPAGSRIALVGNGFTQQDVIVVGGVEAPTEVHSSNSIEFTVPALEAGESYEVLLRTGNGDLNVGKLRVDQAELNVQPESLDLAVGDQEMLVFEVDNPAPRGGLNIDVKTDIPEKIVMPEVTIPEGARSVNISVEAVQSGSGILSVNLPGYSSLDIPVTISE